ncbi:MAG: dihydroorotase [Polaribacter sp.]|jgi:dihydroorotase
MQSITIQAPDDWHLHLRDGSFLIETVAATARCFKRAIVMPNLTPPITTAEMATEYKNRILQAVPDNANFDPLMTLYLTNATTSQTIIEAKAAGIKAVKYYPAGATTNSDSAVNQIEALYPVLQTMSDEATLLLIHGEVTDHDVDIFDRESIFIETILKKIVQSFPDLKIVLEHITTKEAVDFVSGTGANIAATITPQHLLLNRNDLLVGGIRPHNYCLPVLKRNTHQIALQQAVASGSNKFFLGTDSAPHEQYKKESSCGCAGCYSAWSALELYAQIFEDLDALDKLEGFASFYGADFYGLKRNEGKVTLIKEDWQVPKSITLPNGNPITPFFAGETLKWKVRN